MRKQDNDSTETETKDSIVVKPKQEPIKLEQPTPPSRGKGRTLHNTIEPIQVNKSQRAERLEIKQISKDGN
jgi:hypothetical protein